MGTAKKLSMTVLRLVAHVTKFEVERNMFERPPICAGIYHQPKRPETKKPTKKVK